MFSTTTSLLDEAIELFDKVDSLLEGSSADHEIAFGLLAGYESEVVIFAWLIAKFLQIINCFFLFFSFSMQFKHNVEFLWRITKSCRMAAQASCDSNRQKELSYKGGKFWFCFFVAF